MEYNSNEFLEATINCEKVFFNYESVDILSLAKVIWKDNRLAQELLPFLLAKADNAGNRLYTCHQDIDRKKYYFVKDKNLSNVLLEITKTSSLHTSVYGFLESDFYKQVINYTKMSNVFFEMITLQENMFNARDKLAHVKDYLAMFPQHRNLVEFLNS